jgi:hypothetical protein
LVSAAPRCAASSRASASDHLRGGLEDHQQVVEVVRDAAGDLAHRLQPLAFRQRGLMPAVSADLVDDEQREDSGEQHAGERAPERQQERVRLQHRQLGHREPGMHRPARQLGTQEHDQHGTSGPSRAFANLTGQVRGDRRTRAR